MSVGSRITEWRKARGYTQAKLAERAHLSASTIAMYETNRRSPDREAITKLSGALGIPEALLTGEQTTNAKKRDEGLVASKKQSDGQPNKSSAGKAKKDADGAATWVPDRFTTGMKAETSSPGEFEPDVPTPDAPALDGGFGVETQSGNPSEQHQEDADQGDRHDGPTGETSSPSSALTELTLTRDEAKLILFVRMNPQSMEFFESYIKSTGKRREQLTRTWRLINDFQSSPC